MRRAIAVVISVLVVSGCGGGSSAKKGTGGTSGRACVPGMSVACACTNATEGAQVCAADGSGYGACTCTSGPGTGGAGGAAGSTGGTTATGGVGGSAGAAGGAAGTAGSAGGAAGGAAGAAGSAGGAAGGAAGAAGSAGSSGGAGGGVIKSCSTWTTVSFSNFNDGALDGLTTCFSCSGGGCPYVLNQQLYNPAQWNLLCYPGLSATETRAIRISFDVTLKGGMGFFGWDNFAVNLKTSTAMAFCGDNVNNATVTYTTPAADLVGHWDLIRWGGNSFQFNYNSTPLGQIECALPALSGMAIDFHEGGSGLAQSDVDNFRVEVCASAP